MPMQDEMTIDERRKYVKLMYPRYQKANRQERSRLLTEMEPVTKQHRKHLIRLLNGESLERKKRRTPRSRTYGVEVERVVLLIWESLDYICAKRLTPNLLSMGKHASPLWSREPDRRSGRTVANDEYKYGGTPASQVPFPQRTIATQRSPTSQSSHQRSANGSHCLGQSGAGTRTKWIWCIIVGRVRQANMGRRCS